MRPVTEIAAELAKKQAQCHELHAKHFDATKNALSFKSGSPEHIEYMERHKELAGLSDELQGAQEVDIAAKNSSRIAEMMQGRDTLGQADGQAAVKSLGEAFVESQEYLARKSGNRLNDKTGFSVSIDNTHSHQGVYAVSATKNGILACKTLMTRSAGFDPFVTRSDRIEYTPTRPLVIADLIPSDPISEKATKWMEETTFTNNTASIAEGGTFSESALAYTERTISVEKVGTTLPVTDEQLEDEEGIRSVIDRRLTVMHDLTIDSKLLNDDGNTPNLTGILSRPNIQNVVAATTGAVPDKALEALTLIRNTTGGGTGVYANPTAFVFNPTDWMYVLQLKDGNDNYIWGSPAAPTTNRLWGLPVVESAAIAAGTRLAGDFRMFAHISNRKLRTISTGFVNDQFIKGSQTIKIESRLSLELYRQTAFCTITDS